MKVSYQCLLFAVRQQVHQRARVQVGQHAKEVLFPLAVALLIDAQAPQPGVARGQPLGLPALVEHQALHRFGVHAHHGPHFRVGLLAAPSEDVTRLPVRVAFIGVGKRQPFGGATATRRTPKLPDADYEVNGTR